MLRENCYITNLNLANNRLHDAGIISVASMLAVSDVIAVTCPNNDCTMWASV